MNDTGSQIFRDRTEAGRLLASELGRSVNRANVLILALPRGGVPLRSKLHVLSTRPWTFS